MMSRIRGSVLAIGMLMLVAVGARAQRDKLAGDRIVNARAVISTTVQRSLPTTGGTVAASPQANGASPGTIVPRLMKFNGALQDVTGKPLTGPLDLTFTLYSVEAGGDPLWFETQSVQADELGRYTALLGAMHTEGLPVDLFTSGEVRWLGIQVGLEAEQQPRVLLVSVPYALKAGDAETLGGKPASAYMLSDSENGPASTTASSAATPSTTQAGASGKTQKGRTASKSALTACSSVTSDGTAAVNSLALFTTACNVQSSVLTQFNGNLGFGIATPQARLHIFGPDISDANARFNFILGDSTPAAAGVGGGIDFSGYYNGTTNKAGFANIRGVKENATQGDYASAMIFDTRANGGNQTERMRITSAGNLGIGTSTPAAKLDVAGNINISQTTGAAVGVITMGGARFAHSFGTNNTFLGLNAGNFTLTGGTNTGIGASSLQNNTTGINNAAVGNSALRQNTTGYNNIAVGNQALLTNMGGNGNTAIGMNALNGNGGSENTGIGDAVLLRNTTGNNNTAVGSFAGVNGALTLPTTGSNSTFVGANATATVDGLTNAAAVGANAAVGESNALVLGSINGVNGATSSVNVGIGTATPAATLDVHGTGNFTGLVTFAGGQSFPGTASLGSNSFGGNQVISATGTALTASGTGTGSIGVQGSSNDVAGGSGAAGLFINSAGGRIITANDGSKDVIRIDANGLDLKSPIVASIGNDPTTATVLNELAKLTTAGKVTVTSAGDLGGAIGIVVAGAGTFGTSPKSVVAIIGEAGCVFDNTAVNADYIQISPTAAGKCHDAGPTYPSGVQVLGRVTDASQVPPDVYLFGTEARGIGPDRLEISAIAFTFPGVSTADYSNQNLAQGNISPQSANATFTNCGGFTGNNCDKGLANVSLPQGTVITGFQVCGQDNDAQHELAGYLYAKPQNSAFGAPTLMASVHSGIAAGSSSTQCFSTTSIASATIDNAANSYYVELDVGVLTTAIGAQIIH